MDFKSLIEKEQLSENKVRFNALATLREIQGTVSSVSFIDVLKVMKPDNPLKTNVIEMENKLFELQTMISTFINSNLGDVVDDKDQPTDKKIKPVTKPTMADPKGTNPDESSDKNIDNRPDFKKKK